MYDRLEREEVGRILEVSGVLAVSRESTYGEIVRPIVLAARLVRHAPIWDRALVYSQVIDYLRTTGAHIPATTEDLFFDTMTLELHDGQSKQEEGSRLRAQDRSLVAGPGTGGREERFGDAAGEHGGRDSRVEVMVPRRGERVDAGSEADGAGEVPEAAEPVEGHGRSGGSWKLPF